MPAHAPKKVIFAKRNHLARGLEESCMGISRAAV